MGCLKLTVNQFPTQLFKGLRKMYEGQFRGIGNQREHAFAEKGLTQRDTIETTYQPLVAPHLDTGSKALTVELGIGTDDVGTEPGTILLITLLRGGTTPDDTFKVAIDGHLVTLLTDELSHGMADMNLRREDDKALHGAIPQWLVVMAEREPGEKAMPIGQQQTIDAQVATYGYQAVILAQTRVGEP